MMAGRPTDYTKETPLLAAKYLNNHEEFDDLVPTVAGLAYHLGVSRETVYAWAKDKSKRQFSDILTRIQIRQEIKLINGGLSNSFNPAITKMMLTKHGYSDKQEVDHTTKGESFNKIQRTVVDAPDAGD